MSPEQLETDVEENLEQSSIDLGEETNARETTEDDTQRQPDELSHQEEEKTKHDVHHQFLKRCTADETIQFVSNDSVTPVISIANVGRETDTSFMDNLPNEILEKIIQMLIDSSELSWPNHICHVFDTLQKVSIRFREISRRLITRLPSVYFRNGWEPGTVSVRRLLKQFGHPSGLIQEIKGIVAHPKWANAWLKLHPTMDPGWFIIVAILWKNTKKQ